jgi:hypothetical protein
MRRRPRSNELRERRRAANSAALRKDLKMTALKLYKRAETLSPKELETIAQKLYQIAERIRQIEVPGTGGTGARLRS